MSSMKVGIIGGTGLYKIEGLKTTETVSIETPFGTPSDSYLTGELDGVPVAFLPPVDALLVPSSAHYHYST